MDAGGTSHSPLSRMLFPSNAAFIEENNQMVATQQQPPDDSLLSFDLGDLLDQVSQGERQWSSSSPGVATGSQPASRGQSSGLTTNDHTNVYIRGLPLHADEALLSVLFCPFGPIESVRIFRSNQVRSIKPTCSHSKRQPRAGPSRPALRSRPSKRQRIMILTTRCVSPSHRTQTSTRSPL